MNARWERLGMLPTFCKHDLKEAACVYFSELLTRQVYASALTFLEELSLFNMLDDTMTCTALFGECC